MEHQKGANKSSGGNVLDRPSESVPSVDRPWDDPADRAHRRQAIRGDRSQHRVHHAIYEDLLN